jgi:heptose III glucuronosyltransferase
MYETLMTMALKDNLDVAQCNADWCIAETGHTWASFLPIVFVLPA